MAGPRWDDVEVGDTVVFEPVTRKITGFGEVDGLRYALYDGLPRAAEGGWSAGLLVNDELNPVKSVEKPVRTFKPGDVLRLKDARLPGPPLLYIVPTSGKSLRYVHPGYPGELYISSYSVGQATSELFELVED